MRLSLGKKITVLMIAFAVLLSGTCMIVSAAVNRSTMEKEYIITADSMAATVAVIVDGDRMQRITEKVMEIYDRSDQKLSNEEQENPAFEAYAAQYLHLMNDEDYLVIRDQLRKIQDVSEADYIYTICPVPEDGTAVYIVDAASDHAVTPGLFDYAEEKNLIYMNDLKQGVPAFVTNTPEYGWLVTACAPVYNSNGAVVCFAAVDLSMNDVLEKENKFLFMLAGILLILTIMISLISIFYVTYRIVRPINLLSGAARQYGQKQAGAVHHEFSSVDIHTGDELELLHASMIQMEKDIDSYIESLTRTEEQLTSVRQQADDLHELAHMDSLTGIRNRLAYDKEILRLDREIQNGRHEFGIAMIDLNFLKVINDTYGHEFGNTAIITLSQLICDVFSHSPVFRIGGDEFAVILKNHDYHKIEMLSEKFSLQMEALRTEEELRPWEKISAAFGYALFEAETDHCAEDVFKRADQKMYENKKEMKAVRT